MSDDLVKRLRKGPGVWVPYGGPEADTLSQAADRIEELEETLNDACAISNKRLDRIEELEAELRQAFGDMEQTYSRWKNGVRYEVLAKEQGVTRERMRHRLMRYENDKLRQLEAKNALLREALAEALGVMQVHYPPDAIRLSKALESSNFSEKVQLDDAK